MGFNSGFKGLKFLRAFEGCGSHVSPGLRKKLCRSLWKLYRGILIQSVGGCSSVGKCFVLSVYGAQIVVWIKNIIWKWMLLKFVFPSSDAPQIGYTSYVCLSLVYAVSIREEWIASHLHSLIIMSIVSASRPRRFTLGQEPRYVLTFWHRSFTFKF